MSLISLELSKKAHDFEKGGAELRPLSLPDTARLELAALHEADLESAVVDLSAELEPGQHRVPISGGEPVQLEVREGCKLDGHARLVRVEGLGPVVTEISGAFGPPVELHNLLATLGEVRTLFRDRRLGRVLEAAELAKWASRWLSENVELPAALLRALEGRLDAVAAIELASFRATLSRRKGQAELSFRFDGHVRLAGTVRVPFRSVRLPTFILPALHARLEDLLGAHPLASGDLLERGLPVEAFLRAVLPLARAFDASLRANGTLPELQVRTETFNRSRLQVRVGVPGKARLSATAKGHVAGGRMSLEARGAELTLGERRLGADVRVEAAVDDLVALALNAPARGQPLETELWPEREPPQRAITVAVGLHQGSTLSTVETQLKVEHPLASGTTAVTGTLDELGVGGTLELALDPRRRSLSPLSIALDFAGRLEAREGGRLDLGATRLSAESFASRVSGSARLAGAGQPLVLELDSQTDLKAVAEQQLPPVPELSMPDGRLRVAVDGRLLLAGAVTLGGPEGRPGLDFAGSRFDLSLARCDATLDGLGLSLPAGSRLDARVTRGFLNASGLGELEVGLGWDLRGESAVLSSATRRAVLFVEELRRMQVSVGVSPSGRLSFSGGRKEGLYDADYLNAIVDPVAHPEKWLDILSDDAAMDRVFEALGVVSADIEKLARQGRDVFLRVRGVLEQEGVEEPAQFIPRHRMARVLSLALAGDLRLEQRLAEIVRKVTDAEGLDRHAVEQLVSELWPDHVYAFELDRVLRWADHLLGPAEPLPPPAPAEQLPLVERHAATLQGVPSAAELYQAVSAPGPLDGALCDRLVRLAPWLTREQLAWLDPAAGDRLPGPHRARLQFVRELKRRVDLVAKGYGGIGYAPQAMAIAFFLADVLDASAAYHRPLGGGPAARSAGLPCDGILGPEDVAVLLAAGTANVTPSRTAQLNQRMLFDYLLARPPLFLVGVLTEMGLRSPRVLTHVLSSLLNQDQSHLREPLDLPAALGRLLGVELPRRADYMAGGRWAKESYYGALMRTAEFTLGQAEPYLACKHHLQAQRVPAAAQSRITGIGKLETAAKKAIARADQLGEACRFDGPQAEGPLERARQAYEESFAACREVLAADRLAFQKDWLKRFWQRNHEALVVRSVVRNYQDDVDRVRYWLHVRDGRGEFGEGEQRLVEAVIGSLYFFEEDREILRADPLVRLLVDPPKGRYDFTVVTGMGVITEGRAGTELQDAFARLEAQRGVRLVRADTGTAKPLEHNAQKVIEAIEQVQTPYGLIGYSQGCANVLMAEATLLGGTPSRRALLDRLVCRNFLFSAINGSAHGSCGNEKLLRAMVEGELFLKHYQAVFSSSIIETFNRAMDSALNLPMLSVILGSVDSLSHEGVVALARDGQFLAHVPSSTVRGAVVEQTVPEALEMLSHVISRQVRGALHDTQVTLVSAVGHPNRVGTRSARVLERCDMGSLAQSCHHWSPLLNETTFVTTERDRARAIYDFPKDRHLFPWIEVNARFGTIGASRARAGASADAPAKRKPRRAAPSRRPRKAP